jgi:hypothetical protein
MPNGPAPKASNPKNVAVNGVSGPDIFADPVSGGGGVSSGVAGRIRGS